MKGIICSLLIIIIFSFPVKLSSQDAAQVFDKVYGLDQTLCNGKRYNYLPPPNASGHQYLISPDFIVGTINIRGKCFQDITLNYDIFNQQLLLQYNSETFFRNIIEVSNAWLTSFRLGNMNFELLNLDQYPRFYQVLGEGPVRVFYFWRKNLNLNNVIGSSNFIFTPATRDSYVFMDGQLRPFKNKQSLIRIFEPGHRQEIKSYMRKNKVKVKKASDQAMAEMITFIGNIK